MRSDKRNRKKMDVDTEGYDAQFITFNAHLWKTEETQTERKLVQTKLAPNLEFESKAEAMEHVFAQVEQGNQSIKLVSREINFTGARKIVGYSSFTEYWAYVARNVNQKLPVRNRFCHVNDHEMLINDFTHCIYPGVFFDVDCKYENLSEFPNPLKFMEQQREDFKQKTLEFAQEIARVLNNIISPSAPHLASNDHVSIMIQESSSLISGKISFHGFVRHHHLIFDNTMVIKAVLLASVWQCIQNKGVEFFFDSYNRHPITDACHDWLDLGIYAAGRTFRSLYSTKRNSTDRPLLPIYFNGTWMDPQQDDLSKWFTKELFFEGLINMPNPWLFSGRPSTVFYVVKPTTTPKNEEMIRALSAEMSPVISKYDLKAIVRAMEDASEYYKPFSSYSITTNKEQASLDAMVTSSKHAINGRHVGCKPETILKELALKLKKVHSDAVKSPELKIILDKYFEENGGHVSLLTREKGLACIQVVQSLLCEIAYRDTTNYVSDIRRIIPRDHFEQKKIKENNKDMEKIVKQSNWNLQKSAMVPHWMGLYLTVVEKFVHKYFNVLENTSEEECFREHRKTKAQVLEFYRQNIFSKFTLVFHSQNHYCYIKKACHSNNTVYYMVDLVKLQWWQGCYNKNCIAQYKASKEKNNPQAKKKDTNFKESENGRSEKFDFSRDDEDLMKTLQEFKDSLFKEHISASTEFHIMEVDE